MVRGQIIEIDRYLYSQRVREGQREHELINCKYTSERYEHSKWSKDKLIEIDRYLYSLESERGVEGERA